MTPQRSPAIPPKGGYLGARQTTHRPPANQLVETDLKGIQGSDTGRIEAATTSLIDYNRSAVP